jgi:uncharacterized protein (DUF2235 family)
VSKNILIFSDGTGQAGGLTPDEKRTNIYKMYRATRCGPDTNINANEQIAFYDPGLGSQPLRGSTLFRIWRWLYNVFSKATGLGITQNIIDCYAWLLRVYEPGDRIFLFGFSRGAYTVRCLASVLSFCGVPTQMPNGTPIRRDIIGTNSIAKEAVKKVYQFVSSPKDKAYLKQREELAANYRKKYESDCNGESNVIPFFIGVFDTVAALGNTRLSIGLIIISILVLIGISSVISIFAFSLLSIFLTLFVVSSLIAGICYVATHLKFAWGLSKYSWWDRLHFTSWKMKFYDYQLNEKVWYARHALSIDENRADFDRVIWGATNSQGPKRPKEYPQWLEQVWFSGNHSDVGGGYPENESRLSDISLDWMVNAAMNLPGDNSPTGNGIKVDNRYLQLNPNPLGPQHDEREPGFFQQLWSEGLRKIDPNAILHPSVYKRFEAIKGVPHFYYYKLYRPTNLTNHKNLIKFYEN